MQENTIMKKCDACDEIVDKTYNKTFWKEKISKTIVLFDEIENLCLNCISSYCIYGIMSIQNRYVKKMEKEIIIESEGPQIYMELGNCFCFKCGKQIWEGDNFILEHEGLPEFNRIFCSKECLLQKLLNKEKKTFQDQMKLIISAFRRNIDLDFLDDDEFHDYSVFDRRLKWDMSQAYYHCKLCYQKGIYHLINKGYLLNIGWSCKPEIE